MNKITTGQADTKLSIFYQTMFKLYCWIHKERFENYEDGSMYKVKSIDEVIEYAKSLNSSGPDVIYGAESWDYEVFRSHFYGVSEHYDVPDYHGSCRDFCIEYLGYALTVFDQYTGMEGGGEQIYNYFVLDDQVYDVSNVEACVNKLQREGTQVFNVYGTYSSYGGREIEGLSEVKLTAKSVYSAETA